MISYKRYLQEKLITFGKLAYPKFGTVVIMAGGAGSGKGFVKDKLLGVEGHVFDVDNLKTIAAATPGIEAKVQKELGISLKDLVKDLKNPENVRKLHEIIGDHLKLDDKKTAAFYRSIIASPADRKPNIIFDVTLKDLQKLQKLSSQVQRLGYDKKNIHIVWVLNDIEVAKAQNASRPRQVPAEILVNTHKGVSTTLNDILNMGDNLKSYMDGDIVFAFNKAGSDSELKWSQKGGSAITKANYVYIKRQGHASLTVDQLSDEIRKKVASYVPKGADWGRL